jgi:hypothetical protein
VFLHRLALGLGKTIGEIEATMGSAELSDWMDYYQIEPFGAWRDNFHSAQISALIYNVNRGKQKPVKTADFMFVDAETAQDTKDQEFLSFMSSRAKKG